ncbi:Exodeoxyribonuclease III [Arsenophonus endosymbiont of Aleurodicus dispersus]|uniref:exodeoxyribonuclease III n=1 Tax=Arsenophonus endosymbiont of Aleurodicus dispersus TaxID=235559 RepID=UPI000EACCAB4|nr:exodeoxyribonuclease III [Arsenophonus endosymbiont of Aleurodicus dispersus]VAY02443.1 Exodeoxyribonuclease III [Arsenophonus endosymbiont of Aleurodicus dispersus]
MKFVSFNINSLRARIHQLEAIIEKHQPDVIGLQETKVDDSAFPLEQVNHLGYHICYHGQKAHYGVALFCKKKPILIKKGFSGSNIDAQRRIIMVDIETEKGIITIINGYFPQGECRDHPTKFAAKAKFFQDLQLYLQNNLLPKSHVILMGDMNISPTDHDIGIGEINKKRWLSTGKCSFLPEERKWMDKLKSWGLIDTYRKKNPEIIDQFSWFDYRSNGFFYNRGLRIDLILASNSLFACCGETGIDYAIRSMKKSSDHAPIWANFNLS